MSAMENMLLGLLLMVTVAVTVVVVVLLVTVVAVSGLDWQSFAEHTQQAG